MATSDFSFNATTEVLSVFLVGALIEIPLPPSYKNSPDLLKFQPGTYFVDSIVVHANRTVEIGISEASTREHIGYFKPMELKKFRVVSKGIFFA